MEEIGSTTWQAYFDQCEPFLSWPFLRGLESSGCTTAQSGWQPAHIGFEQDDALLGLVPAYLKTHSYGEYVFDWSWADAWHRMGLDYYPKLVTAIPFTPATGQRFGYDSQANQNLERMAVGMQALCKQLNVSSWHVLFIGAAESARLS
ncbi:MAG: GNAT family N-acetyltransferase, partial [Halieaceae bacterium]|nr:GNAT family N-acetyltransferase [Halieaceae bacterium]